ncbi:MAG: hypothetical protein FWE55_05310 [Synergistaceae bacterium]|nr:hypothetical protein [Synergistaceae bacterium]
MSSVPPSFEFDYPTDAPRGRNDFGAVFRAMAVLTYIGHYKSLERIAER